MGNHSSSSIYSSYRRWATRHERRLLLIGLDGAGKTTLLCHLRMTPEGKTVLPTLDFNVDTVTFEKLTLNIWDLGGQDTLRPYWRHHYTGTQGIIFVLDSVDHARLSLAKEELHHVLNDAQLEQAQLLVMLNKQDLVDGPEKEASHQDALIAALDFQEFCTHRKVHVQPTVATTGVGVEAGLHWLCRVMEEA